MPSLKGMNVAALLSLRDQVDANPKKDAMSRAWSNIAAIAFVFAMSDANAESNKKIDLHCYFEETAYADRFEGMYSTNEEGTGTWKIDADRGRVSKASFRLSRGVNGKGPGALLIYPEPDRERDTKIPLQRIIFRVDKTYLDPQTQGILSNMRLIYRAFSVLQDDPITSPVPFTQILAGTCRGTF